MSLILSILCVGLVGLLAALVTRRRRDERLRRELAMRLASRDMRLYSELVFGVKPTDPRRIIPIIYTKSK